MDAPETGLVLEPTPLPETDAPDASALQTPDDATETVEPQRPTERAQPSAETGDDTHPPEESLDGDIRQLALPTSAASVAPATSAALATGLAATPDTVEIDPVLEEPTVGALGLPPLADRGGHTERPVAPVPARLAVPVWAERLAQASGGRTVRVSLGDDGAVRLQTTTSDDGVTTVHLRFSDPDLQALAGQHAGRLREVLDGHFSDPIRLSLDADSGPGDFGSGGSPGDGAPARRDALAPHSTAPASRAPQTSTLAPTRLGSGQREWVG